MELTTNFLTGGISGVIIGASLLWIMLKVIAPKTETKWDDRIVDIIEGMASEANLDLDEIAKKSTGKLKEQIIKKI